VKTATGRQSRYLENERIVRITNPTKISKVTHKLSIQWLRSELNVSSN